MSDQNKTQKAGRLGSLSVVDGSAPDVTGCAPCSPETMEAVRIYVDSHSKPAKPIEIPQRGAIRWLNKKRVEVLRNFKAGTVRVRETDTGEEHLAHVVNLSALPNAKISNSGHPKP